MTGLNFLIVKHIKMHIKEKKTSVIYHTDKQTAIEAIESKDYTYSTKGAFKRYNNAVKQYMNQRMKEKVGFIKPVKGITDNDSNKRRTGYFDFHKRRKAAFPVYSHMNYHEELIDNESSLMYNYKRTVKTAYWKPK